MGRCWFLMGPAVTPCYALIVKYSSTKNLVSMGRLGFIIQDSDGDVVQDGRGQLNHLLDSIQAEMIACLQGVQAAIDLGISRVVLES